MKSARNIAQKAENRIDNTKIKVKDALNLFDPVIIYGYRGYGNSKKALVKGRILEKERMIHEDQELKDNLWNNLRKLWKRYESDEIPGVELEGEFHGVKATTTSNEEGYFTLIFVGLDKKNIPDGWHDVSVKITNMPFRYRL